ncbi:leucyl/phenylalanyl-tRNA--protein transferase [Altererythrobacter sp. KTW20L]|uniref:leucyl/phenylalanyl-tRNA--protein transferase n=1 Tax=Altererythrobacter sp. KTW20L TaxID=2942210 RepID=UPI0020BF7AF1|nr:leucyl/phenylalanyl-tRNA--protein transferase [Altererythrobacter sp. KTW20L]MCL6250307.1 leucyl/phenylalanyl-tRNA--protein transferase [Altererythrobacter sp. KTW20L]
MHGTVPAILPPELLLRAYRGGVFPMADSRDDTDVFWVEPRTRAVFPLETFRPSRSLAKVLRQDRFTVTCNRDFAGVIRACAEPRPDHPDTWISHRIEASYIALHHAGHAHSIECWLDGALAGGLYGVSFGRVFCGESMFSRADNASKVALAWLVALMRLAQYRVLDCQFMTDHLGSLGAVEVKRDLYRKLVDQACADGFQADLEAAWNQAVGASGAGAVAGSAGAAGAAAGAPPADGADRRSASSSPGKVIAQSFTHTS